MNAAILKLARPKRREEEGHLRTPTSTTREGRIGCQLGRSIARILPCDSLASVLRCSCMAITMALDEGVKLGAVYWMLEQKGSTDLMLAVLAWRPGQRAGNWAGAQLSSESRDADDGAIIMLAGLCSAVHESAQVAFVVHDRLPRGRTRHNAAVRTLLSKRSWIRICLIAAALAIR